MLRRRDLSLIQVKADGIRVLSSLSCNAFRPLNPDCPQAGEQKRVSRCERTEFDVFCAAGPHRRIDHAISALDLIWGLVTFDLGQPSRIAARLSYPLKKGTRSYAKFRSFCRTRRALLCTRNGDN
jgi:hypothetical protein